MFLKDKVKWYGVISGCVFLTISTYISVKHVFWNAGIARLLEYFALVAALLALGLGLLSLPRWQSFFALAIVAYALYWFTHAAIAVP
jgi:hypothetical protein